MNVLVATRETQGQRRFSDFCFVDEGELVKYGTLCDRDKREGPDGGCGCGRALVGMEHSKGTTTFMVADVNISREEYFEKYAASEIKDGWKYLEDYAEELLNVAARWKLGTVLEYRNELFAARTV